MLRVDRDLPVGALLPRQPRSFADELSELGAAIYEPSVNDAGTCKRLEDKLGRGPSLEPVEDNEAGCVLEQNKDLPYLVYRTGMPSGFASSAPTTCDEVSVACIIWAREEDPKTVLALCPPGDRNYLFLSVAEGKTTFGFRDQSALIEEASNRDWSRPTLIAMHADPESLSLMVGGGNVISEPSTGFQAGEQDLFIGCRRHRPGLRNTLGAMRLSHVFLFPNLNLFAPEGVQTLEAMRGHLTEIRDAI